MPKIMTILALSAALGLGHFATTAEPAQAQGVTIGPGGVRIHPGPRPGVNRHVGAREANQIARSRGMANVRATIRTGNEWRVRGLDRRGAHLRVDIDRRTGQVNRITRRW